MIPTVYRISLDIHSVDSQGMLPVKAGDTARALHITLSQKGVPYPLTSDLQAMLAARKADGTLLLDSCQVTEEGIKYDFSSQLTAVPGEVLCELRLYGKDGMALTSPRFSLLVSETVAEDDEIVESSHEFTALRELLEETREIKEQWEELMEDAKGCQCDTEEQTAKMMLALQDFVLDKIRENLDSYEGTLMFNGGYFTWDGYFHLTMDGLNIEGFEPIYFGIVDQIPEDLTVEGDRLYLSKNGEPMGEGVTLPAGGGGGSDTGSVMKLLSRNDSATFSVPDTAEEVLLLYSWSSLDSEDGTPTGKGSASWFVGDKRVATGSVEQGDGSFNILPYLEIGVENTVKLTVEDAYGNSRSRVWTVTVISFGLSWDLELMSCHPSQAMSIRMIPTGMGEKTLRVFVDGKEEAVRTVATSGRTVSVDIPALSHGVHRVKATLELVADGETVEAQPLEHVGIWYAEGNATPVVAFFHERVETPRYSTVTLPYLVYDPLVETAIVSLTEDGREVSTLTVGRGMEVWAYRPREEGSKTLQIAVLLTETQATLPVTVTPLAYDIAPVTAGLVMECSPAGHSNKETNKEFFGYTDGQGNNHPFLFSQGFDWENGGFKQDSEGVTALVMKRGSTITLDKSFFEGDATASGKELKLILKVTNCRDYEAEFLTCYHSPVGLRLKAQEGVLSSESGSLTFPYCEGEKLEIDLNIGSTKEQSLASVWLGGIPSGLFAYGATDAWAQATARPAVIGSEDCDVWLYGFRLYGNSLTREDILANFIADGGTTEEIIGRYERNDIYASNGSLSLSKLRDANPDLRILEISASDMTTSKTHEVTCDVDLTHKKGQSFTATGVVMKAQGTSSLEYGLAALNLDLDFSDADWKNGKGEQITAFSMEETSVPVNYFNIKLNVASSENANNVVLAGEYNDHNPFRSQPRLDNNADPDQTQKIRDTVEGHPCAVFLTNKGKTTITAGARTVAPGETILYGCGDMNNSKKNFAVFGQDSSRYPNQCCVEILNNNNAPCRFRAPVSETETWDGVEGTSDFEFRYPKKPTEEMKEAFRSLVSWVFSTNPEGATGQSLLRPALFEGVTYNTDSAAYRKAKFRGELGEHFSVDSLLFHYLFTEYHLMVDNRAKNCFLSYEWDQAAGGYRWNFNKDYDNDTAAGTDNSGGLSFRYGMEDTDSIGAQTVYNAADSVLWCNLRDTMGAELKAMFHSLESQKLWDTDRLLEAFRTYQSARPEILVAEDMWAKYVMPYTNCGEKRYLEMAQGTKAHQRAQFYRYRRPYLSSKYRSSYATSDSLALRINAVSDLTVTPYSDVYVGVKFGNADMVTKRGKRGEEVHIPCSADTANDLETYVYSSGSLSRLGDLSGLMTSEIELNSAVKLRNLPLGSQSPGYENKDLTQLSFGTISGLETMDLSGLSMLTGTVDLSQFDGLRTFYAAGSGITGVIFAPNAPVTEAVLPRVGTLVLRGQRKLSRLSFDPADLMNLRLEGCPQLDSYDLCAHAGKLQRGRVTQVNWPNAETDVLLRLSGLTGYDGEGRPTDTFVLTGSAYVPTICEEELDILHSTFPNLELTYGEKVPSYTVTFQKEDGTLLYTATVRQGGTCADPVATGKIPAPTMAPTVSEEFTFAGWDFPLTNIVSNMVLTARFASVTRRYTVRWFDGSRLLQTDTVEVYDSVSYRGADPVPTEKDVIWIGWDKPFEALESVTGDMDVYAVYIAPLEEVTRREDYDYLYSDNGEDRSGYTLQEFYSVIARGLAPDYFRIGDKIKISTHNQLITDRQIVLQVYGFRRYPLSEGGEKAAVVFGMKGVLNSPRRFHSASVNAVGWAGSEIRDHLNNTLFPALPQHWKAMIKTVTLSGLKSGTSDEVNLTHDRLFLFAYGEVVYKENVPFIYETDPLSDGGPFPLFTDNGSRIKSSYNGTGSACSWWLRTPKAGTTSGFYMINQVGSDQVADTICVAAKESYLSFGFCL